MSGDRKFSHLDSAGRASMVDVSEKPVTRRVAAASCRILLEPSTLDRLGELPKGDALAVARIAGVQAAKRTGELIPLAHPLTPEDVQLDFEPADGALVIRSRVVVTARTGAEMEALTACSLAALALYDMVKAVDRTATVTDLRLDSKSGGVSGDFQRPGGGQDD
ncbi:MAG: cyclic pyranopterin monophosphate synthase MoaC [bacterium]|nr:cyclic pyranopterin monophosphate synthase MoaC [bacterium]